MIWQDAVLSAGSFVFVVALVPSVISKDKPAFSTSILTGGVLLVFAGVYASLGLWLSMVVTTFTAGLWLVLAGQKYAQKHRVEK